MIANLRYDYATIRDFEKELFKIFNGTQIEAYYQMIVLINLLNYTIDTYTNTRYKNEDKVTTEHVIEIRENKSMIMGIYIMIKNENVNCELLDLKDLRKMLSLNLDKTLQYVIEAL